MHITFYSNNSDKRYINKDLDGAIAIEGEFKINENILHPTIELIVDGSIPKYTIMGRNYCYIQEFLRYYYISHWETLEGNRIKAYCDVDVLSSWKTKLLGGDDNIGINGLVIKAENPPQGTLNYAQDIPIEQNKTCICQPIGNLGNTHSYYLTVNGGASL